MTIKASMSKEALQRSREAEGARGPFRPNGVRILEDIEDVAEPAVAPGRCR